MTEPFQPPEEGDAALAWDMGTMFLLSPVVLAVLIYDVQLFKELWRWL